MHSLALLILLAIIPPKTAAQILPGPGKAVGIVQDDTPGAWAVVSQDFSSVDVTEFNGTEKDGWLGCYFEGTPGRYLAIKSGSGKLKTFAIQLGGVAPVPPGPIPPPPDPTPVPPPAPVTGPIRVLILYETADQAGYSRDALAALHSPAVITYLRSHCAVSSVGGFAEYGIWDDDLTQDSVAHFGDGSWNRTYDAAVKDSGANTPTSKEPWLLIEQKGTKVFSGPLLSEDDALGQLKKVGGP